MFPRKGRLQRFFLLQEKRQLRNKECRPHDLSRHWGDVAILHRRFAGPQSVSLRSRPCVCPAPQSLLAAPSLPPVVFALMKLTIHDSFICARWAGFGLPVYQPINLGPGMTSLYGLSESKGRSSSSYVKISYGNRELVRKLLN